MSTEPPRYGHSERQSAGLRQWLASIRTILRTLSPEDRNKPLKFALSETGWTIEENKRRFAHHEVNAE